MHVTYKTINDIKIPPLEYNDLDIKMYNIRYEVRDSKQMFLRTSCDDVYFISIDNLEVNHPLCVFTSS